MSTNSQEDETEGLRWEALFRGAIRESLAAVNAVARIGIQQTNAWERPMRYVSDDNQGNVGIASFAPAGVVAAFNLRSSERAIDVTRTLREVPIQWKPQLRDLCALPLLQEGAGISGIIWTDGGKLTGAEPWVNLWGHGARMFARELMPDSRWSLVGPKYFDLSAGVTRLVLDLANRASIAFPMLVLQEAEVRTLVPDGAPFEPDARSWLFSEGLFRCETG